MSLLLIPLFLAKNFIMIKTKKIDINFESHFMELII